jgi:Bacterial Ig-like domain (group 1)
MKHFFLRLPFRFVLILLLSISSILVTEIFAKPSHAASGISGLSVSVGYAEDKHQSSLSPAAFPVPWSGSPNTVFLGNPVFGSSRCGTLPHCYDAGAIRLDNSGSSDVTIDSVSVDDHSSIPGGKVFNLWGSFTVPAGMSVILTENPPGNNPSYDNFDTSGAPKGNCTPISVAPTVTIIIGGVPTTLVDSTHVLDTNGIDTESCQVQQNESIQWRQIGTAGIKTATLTLSPTTTTQLVGQQVTEKATLVDGSGSGLPNANVTFTVTSGPNGGQSGSTLTDQTGQASFTYTDTAPGTDIVVASVATAYTVGPLQSNQTSILWTNDTTQVWSGADIGNPPLVGSDSLSNGIWTVAGSGTDIGGTADQFHFVWQPLTSDGGIRAQVLTQTNTNSLARTGVMLRQSTDPSAPFYTVVVTSQRGIFVLKRATQGGGVSTVTSLAGTVPVYLQVQRTGTTFTAYTSSDGSTWTPIPGSSVTLNLTGTLLAGMAVTSHTQTKVNTATFGAVSTP